MKISELNGKKFELAIERFKEGNSSNFSNISIIKTKNGDIHCSVISSWLSENVTEKRALKDFIVGHNSLKDLIANSPMLKEMINGKELHYSLIEDYGTGSVELCKLIDDKIVWPTSQ